MPMAKSSRSPAHESPGLGSLAGCQLMLTHSCINAGPNLARYRENALSTKKDPQIIRPNLVRFVERICQARDVLAP
jgi:hypothetical protein